MVISTAHYKWCIRISGRSRLGYFDCSCVFSRFFTFFCSKNVKRGKISLFSVYFFYLRRACMRYAYPISVNIWGSAPKTGRHRGSIIYRPPVAVHFVSQASLAQAANNVTAELERVDKIAQQVNFRRAEPWCSLSAIHLPSLEAACRTAGRWDSHAVR